MQIIMKFLIAFAGPGIREPGYGTATNAHLYVYGLIKMWP